MKKKLVFMLVFLMFFSVTGLDIIKASPSVPAAPTELISLKGDVIELWVGRNTVRVNGQSRPIDSLNSNVKPIIIPPGRIMLPLRFVTENLGCTVDWNPTLQEAKVTYTAP